MITALMQERLEEMMAGMASPQCATIGCVPLHPRLFPGQERLSFTAAANILDLNKLKRGRG